MIKFNSLRKIVLTFVLLSSALSFAQEPDPNLFQTWYLTFLQDSDEAPEYNILDIVPSITPTLTISENFDFTGNGACNSFSGIFKFPFDNAFQRTDFTSTDLDCDVDVHSFFESSYFNMLEGGFFNIAPQGDGMILKIENAIFGIAIFESIELGLIDINLPQIKVFPNPSNEVIYIESSNTIYQTILTSMDGRIIKIIKETNPVINVSTLPSGMYVLKIDTDTATVNKTILVN